MKDSDISTPNIPNENFNFTILKSLNELNNLSRFMDRLYNFLKDKMTFENNALDEKNSNSNENQEFYNFSFKIKVSLTLKNHNNEMLGSFHSLILSLNSFFSIIFQISQVRNL